VIRPSFALFRASSRPVRTLAGLVLGFGVLLLGLACEPGIPTAPGAATSVRLTPRGAVLEVGDSVRATAAALDASGMTLLSGRHAQWSSSQPGIARVDSTGWVRGLGPGTAILTATVDGVSDTASITILPASVRSVDLGADTVTYLLGQTRQLTAVTRDRNGNVLTGRVVTWGSSAPGVADVSASGMVTATGLGTATITATSETRFDTVRVRVIPVPVKQVVVTPNPALVQLGATLQLAVDTRDSVGGSLSGRTVDWSSNNNGIASVNSTGLVTGASLGNTSVIATSEGITTTVPVTVAAPSIGLSRTSVTMTERATGPNPAAEQVSITNTGAFTLSGLATSITYGGGQPTGWLAASLNQGTAPATLTLQATTGSLAPGTYTATVNVTSSVPGVTPASIAVSFTVVPQPQIGLSATAPSFGAQTSGPNPSAQTVAVTNSGTGTLSGLSIATAYAGGQPTGWLNASINATTAPATITLQPLTGTLGVGTYNATVTVSSTQPFVTARTINVTFNVVAGPAIGLSATAISPSATAFSTTPVTNVVNVTNLGSGTLDGLSQSVSYGSGSGWLTATLGSTTAPTTLTLDASAAALAAGTYTATVTVASTVPGAASRTVTVTFTVGSQPIIVPSATSATFDVTRGAALPTATVLNIANGGGGTLSGLARSVSYGPGATGWLTATLGGTVAPTTLSLQPNTTSLTAGTYTATVSLTSTVPGVASVDVPVTLVVRQPQIALSTGSVALGSVTRGATIASSNINVTNGGQGALTGLSVSDDASWITPSLGSGTAPTTLTLAYNTAGLTAGSYTGTVTVSSTVPGVASQTVTVGVTVLQPQIGLSVTSASRTVNIGSNATGVTSTISNSGSGTLSGLSLGTVTYGAGASGWVSASISTTGGGLPANVSITVNSSIIASAGTFTATIPVTSSVPGVVTQNITVTVTTQWSFASHISPMLAGCNGCHSFTAWSNIVNVAPTLGACAGTGRIRVIAFNSASSLIYRKLADVTPPCGGHMPSSTTFWSAADLQKLREWIDAGAPNN
jgi:hypothetical protein